MMDEDQYTRAKEAERSEIWYQYLRTFIYLAFIIGMIWLSNT